MATIDGCVLHLEGHCILVSSFECRLRSQHVPTTRSLGLDLSEDLLFCQSTYLALCLQPVLCFLVCSRLPSFYTSIFDLNHSVLFHLWLALCTEHFIFALACCFIPRYSHYCFSFIPFNQAFSACLDSFTSHPFLRSLTTNSIIIPFAFYWPR